MTIPQEEDEFIGTELEYIFDSVHLSKEAEEIQRLARIQNLIHAFSS